MKVSNNFDYDLVPYLWENLSATSGVRESGERGILMSHRLDRILAGATDRNPSHPMAKLFSTLYLCRVDKMQQPHVRGENSLTLLCSL